MSGQTIELLDLVARWIHVIAGIMWVGNSLLFNWLDRNLRPRSDGDVYGDIWLIHSGGFYLVEKNKGERAGTGARALPDPLHWFKWQAYTTWLSGAALLVVVYYLGGRALIVDPAVANISPSAGTLFAIGTIVGGWLLYEAIWRTIGRRQSGVAAAISVILLVVAVELLLSRLSGRAAYVHVGAMLGTLMAGNVAFTIMPSQRELVAALRAGREPSQEIADRAKTRSIHNNYLTFPVIVLMLSSHFPSLYAHDRSDLALFTLVASGAAVRHWLNIRFTFPKWKVALAGTIAATLLLLAAQLGVRPFQRRPHAGGTSANVAELDSLMAGLPGNIPFVEARRVLDRRCTACHSATPSDVSLGVMPGGVAFDTPEQIQALVARIRERAIVTRTMPPANKTMLTERERAILAKWIAEGGRMK
ncbi:MAG: urate hydroxylase PuuD [Gemmatimonadaceae bacterium]